MNHLGDTNKMVSDTPRTNNQIGYDGSTMSAIRIDFCRKLERELNAAYERINRLEEAGDAVESDKQALKKILSDMGAVGSMGLGSTVKWVQAKEAKL